MPTQRPSAFLPRPGRTFLDYPVVATLEDRHFSRAIIEETYQLYGLIPRLEYVRAWRPLYFGVMRRMGLFNDIPVESKAGKSYFKGAAN